MAHLSASRAEARTAVKGAKADAVLWILAGASVALLIYEVRTLITAVLLPLLANPNALQTDFHYYYDAAVRFRADPSRLYLATDDVIAGFAYPPPAIAPFIVLSYLPFGMSLLVFTVTSYVVLAATIASWLSYLRRRGVAIDSKTAVAAAAIGVALGPTYSNAVFGQVNAIVLGCAVGFMTIGPTRPAIGGVLLAAGMWLKIYPVLMAAVGLWNRSAWRRLMSAIAASVLVVLFLSLLIPFSSYVTFVADVLPARFDKTAVHITNQSLIAFLERFALQPERYLHWTGEQAITVSAVIRALNWAFGVAVIALLWRRATHGPRVEAIDSAACLVALAAVITPLGWGHTYVLVVPLVMLHLVSLRDAGVAHAVAVCACVAALMIPAGRRFAVVEALPAALQNLVYSRYLLATLLLIALPPAIAPNTEPRRPS